MTKYLLLVNGVIMDTKNGANLCVGNCKANESGPKGGLPSIFFKYFVRTTYHARLGP